MAYGHPAFGHPEEYARLRKELGKWLKASRKHAGVTQNEVAKALGLEYYTMISQIEAGRARIPPENYESYAQAIHVSIEEFWRRVLKAYDPYMFKLVTSGDRK